MSEAVHPAYTGEFVFDNDVPCVGASAPRDVAATLELPGYAALSRN